MFYFFLIFYLFILAALGISCLVRDLLVVACGIYFPDQGLNLGPLHWKHGVLTAGPPGKSPLHVLDTNNLPTKCIANTFLMTNWIWEAREKKECRITPRILIWGTEWMMVLLK